MSSPNVRIAGFTRLNNRTHIVINDNRPVWPFVETLSFASELCSDFAPCTHTHNPTHTAP